MTSITDNALLSTLRIVHRNKACFLGRDSKEIDDIELTAAESVPVDDAFYYIGGESICNDGDSIDSVFYIDSRGEVFSVYWLLDDEWYEQKDRDARRKLGKDDGEIFPLDYRFSIPLGQSGT